MHSLAQRVLSHIRRQELLKAGDRVGVAVSGGIDSVTLLRLLLELRGELGIVLSVVHFNHKLRGAESDADEQFVGNLAREHGLEFYTDAEDVGAHASQKHASVEAAARELRYGWFRRLLGESGPQGLKPSSLEPSHRGAEAPLLHGSSDGAAERHALSISHREVLDKVVTGHTLDDQAETVLMRMIRGSGTRGLGGIHPRIAVEDEEGEFYGEIVRPLLTTRRSDLEQYLKDIGQSWREDSSNADDSFTRNRVRRLLVPLLEKEFNPAIAENLAELAEIARDEEDFWENEVAGWMGTGVHWSEPDWAKAQPDSTGLVQIGAAPQGLKPASLLPSDGTAKTVPFPDSPSSTKSDPGSAGVSDVQSRIEAAPWLVANASVDRVWFLGEPIAAQRRVIKAIGERAGIPLEFKHVEEIRRCAEDEASGKEVSLPLGWRMVREPDALVFVTPDLRQLDAHENYDYELVVPGQTAVAEIHTVFDVLYISAAEASRYHLDQLLDAASLARPLRLRNWRAGDRFWPAHTKSPKKIKELLQERHAQPGRKLWPVVVSGVGEIVWMRGFPTPAEFQPQPGHDAILIAEKA